MRIAIALLCLTAGIVSAVVGVTLLCTDGTRRDIAYSFSVAVLMLYFAISMFQDKNKDKA